MVIRESRRNALVDRLCDHVLAAGLGSTSLRVMAAALGTSDRMLLYYFPTKEALITAVLERIAGRLSGMLDAAIPPGTRLDDHALLSAVWVGVSAPALAAYMRVWLELAAMAARSEEPHLSVARGIASHFHDWIASRLTGAEAGRGDVAARMFASIEGMVLLDAVGRRDLAEAALVSRSAR